MIPAPEEANIARVIALRLGCGKTVPAFTVQRNCASGMQALDSAAQMIASGRHNLMLAGGTDAMSRAPLLFNNGMVNWLADLQAARNFPARLKAILKFRPKFLAPIISIIGGLTDPIVSLNMGQTAENVAYQFGITRTQMDEFSVRSHPRLAQAQDNGLLNEIMYRTDQAVPAIKRKAGVGNRMGCAIDVLPWSSPEEERIHDLRDAGIPAQVLG